MKYLYCISLLIINVLGLNAQTKHSCQESTTYAGGYIAFCEEGIVFNHKLKRVYLQTTIKTGKEHGFPSYRLFINTSIFQEKRMGKLYPEEPSNVEKSKTPKQDSLFQLLDNHYALYINNQAFTGFLRLATSFYEADAIPYSYTGNSLYIYQFKKGKFEKLDFHGDIDLETEQGVARPDKPVLYLYPTQEQKINVQIHLTNHRFRYTYPAYENGWNVVAKPDGTLKNLATNREHYCLFWETKGVEMMSKIESGFVVTGKETEAFLEEKLATLGLSPKEINEFIIYWLPQMENNAYNAIYFAQSEYEAISELQITPQPNTTIRVMMLWQKLEKPMQLKEQKLPETPIRTGFVAVEWGGTVVHNFQPTN